jgi:hypothetical protein
MSCRIVPDPQLQCSRAFRDHLGRGTGSDQVERSTHLSPQEEKGSSEERNIVMSNVMKPPPEYSSPPYPNYAPVPGSSQQPRKSYRWVWITLGILALLCIIGGGLLIWGIGSAINTYGGATIASDQYYNAIRDGDYARAYTFLGSDVKAGLSQQAFTQQAQQQDGAYGLVNKFSYTNVPIGDPANATLTVTRANGTSYTVHLEMRQEGGVWKITAFDRI